MGASGEQWGMGGMGGIIPSNELQSSESISILTFPMLEVRDYYDCKVSLGKPVHTAVPDWIDVTDVQKQPIKPKFTNLTNMPVFQVPMFEISKHNAIHLLSSKSGELSRVYPCRSPILFENKTISNWPETRICWLHASIQGLNRFSPPAPGR